MFRTYSSVDIVKLLVRKNASQGFFFFVNFFWCRVLSRKRERHFLKRRDFFLKTFRFCENNADA